jgi:glutamine amidotransferase
VQPDNPLFAGISAEQYMYFVHSYYAETTPEYTLTETEYILPFASSVVSGNVYGVQFHPEKSGAAGLKILKNFVGLI